MPFVVSVVLTNSANEGLQCAKCAPTSRIATKTIQTRIKSSVLSPMKYQTKKKTVKLNRVAEQDS